MIRRTVMAAGAALALLAVPETRASRVQGPPVDAGLFFSRSPVTGIPDAQRVRAAGPVVERIHQPSGRTFCALRPVFASLRETEKEESATHVLWPLFTSRRRGGERSWNAALVAWGRDADIRDPAAKWSFMLLPFLAFGRTEQGRNYGAVFPLGGRLEETAGKDLIEFALFPLYAHTRQGNLDTWNVLFPLISWTRAPDESRFRVFPFYGQAREPGIRRRFVLWPIWTQARYSAPQAEGYSWVLFPVAGRVNLENQQTWMAIPPLFRHTRTEDTREWMAPWPFVQIKRSPDDRFTYVWPLYGQRERPGRSNRFVLWPIGRSEHVRQPLLDQDRLWVAPFYFGEKRVERPPEGAPVEGRRVRVWPLATYQRQGDRMEFHTLELWPAAPVPAVERLYAPFWTIYSHERAGRDVTDELLWGLFRRNRGEGYARTSVFPLVSWGGSKDNESRSWDVLKGFVGYEREGAARRWRILYLWFD